MASQNYRSLRAFAEMSPPAAFDKADPESYLAFLDPAIEQPDPFTGQNRPVQQSKSSCVLIIVDSGTVEWSYDGTNVHGKALSDDGVLRLWGVRETEIYLRQSGGAAAVRVFAW